MPQRPPRPCAQPGCRELSSTGRCEKHRREYRREKDQRLGKAHQRGYDKQWERHRASVLARCPLCIACLKDGQTGPAEELDHAIPRALQPSLFWESWNHHPLCRKCHRWKSGRENAGWLFGLPTAPFREADVHLIVGPPCAGKTTAARQEGRTVVDLDDWKHLPLEKAFEQRADVLRRGGRFVAVALAPTEAERKWWQLQTGCTIIELDTNRETCIARAQQRHDPDKWTRLIDGWFSARRWSLAAAGQG